MSLHIYFDKGESLPDLPFKSNVETLFMTVQLDGCEYDKKILKYIEEGEYFSNIKFVDRFGCLLMRDYLSTGSKAALCLYHLPDVLISGVEMGCNAIAEVARHCDRGNLVLPSGGCYIECDLEDEQIDIICRGKHYTSLYKFADYMMEVAPYDSVD